MTSSDIDNEVNRILKKISEQGQESLTWREKRTLGTSEPRISEPAASNID